MIATVHPSSLKIYQPGRRAYYLTDALKCPYLASSVLDMLKGNLPIDELKEWLHPNFAQLIERLDFGRAGKEAKQLWDSSSSLGNVLVYGDYDTDGISSTVLAMEIFRNKAAQVKYFIPRRDVHGYGLNPDIVAKIPGWRCNTLVVVDCGTNDSALLQKLLDAGVKVFVFDHHSLSAPITIPAVVNPCINSAAGEQQKLCATAVLWCWAWKENIVPKQFLRYEVDLPAIATIADCMPLHSLNRLLVRYGINQMRTNPRRGINALFTQLNINKEQLTEEHLAMRVIPCLNAPGRLASADPAVQTLIGAGNSEAVHSCVSELTRINRKRQALTEHIASEIDDELLVGKVHSNVIFRNEWPVGVLSGVASRFCAQYNRPIVLAAPVSTQVIRGTLRVPEGGDAVGVLRQVADKLAAWGGHKYAAGFSVNTENWLIVRNQLDDLLANLVITPEPFTQAINISPARIRLTDWSAVSALGPFGNDNPAPKFFTKVAPAYSIFPLGKDGKHSYTLVDHKRMLAFNTPPYELAELAHKSMGWIYHPRLDYWRNEIQLQFILDCAVLKEGD